MAATYAPLTLERLPTILRRNLRSYDRFSDLEDAVQEGLIRAWRDLEEGAKDDTWIIRRAGVWAKASLTDINKLPTGHPGRTREGMHKKDSAYDQVQAAKTELETLYGRTPTQSEVAKAADLPKSVVGHHFHLRVENAIYRNDPDGRRRIDRTAYHNVPLLVEGSLSGDVGIHPEAESKRFSVSDEEAILSKLQFEYLISTLDDELKTVATLHYKEDKSFAQIRDIMEYPNTTMAQRRVGAALDQIRVDIFGITQVDKPKGGNKVPGRKVGAPKRFECKEGHEMTPENSGPQANGRGVYCRTCSRAKARARYAVLNG